jgi:16S rRNA (guanine(966)-N(2))-methyltransferase RsmD
VREAVFNMLSDVGGAKILELFAGSGAFGIEFISRGARHVTFVDNNSHCTDVIKSNLEALGVPGEKYDIIRANALSIFARLEKQEEQYDIIFLDPPYYKNIARKCLLNIEDYDILPPAGLVIVEHFKKDSLLAKFRTLVLEKEKRYGDTVISMFRKSKGTGTWKDEP